MIEQKVGCVPDGYMPIPTAEQLADALDGVRCFHDMSAELIAPELLANLLASTTVKAERVCETGGTVSELLAAIMHFGSEKWAEGRGAADPELANVRAAWDSVYSLVQDLATRPEQTEQQATVKAEQAPTPEFVWVRLLEALAGDNGCPITASTDDYREAKPALLQLIAAGFFRDDADSLDGDIWAVAAGEQGEAAARFASCPDAYAVLSDVLNRVFDRPDEAPSLPAAGLADLTAVRCQCCATEYPHDSYDAGFIAGSGMCQVCDAAMPPKDLPAAGSAWEEVEVVAWMWRDLNGDMQFNYMHPEGQELMTVAQHERIVAALSAQQSAQQSAQPEFCCKHSYKVAKRKAWNARRIDRCKCDHNEYCDHCWPADFRPGGKWHGKFVAQQSAQDVSVDLGIKAAVNFIEKKAADYAMEQGHDDMGGLSFGSGPYAQIRADYHSGLLELADELRAILNGGEA